MPDPSKSRKGKRQEKDNKVASYEEQPRAVKSEVQRAANMKALLPIKHPGGLEYRWLEKENKDEEEEEEEVEEGEAKEEIEMEQGER